jgi:transcriptional regulator with XRE-family HTH domain
MLRERRRGRPPLPLTSPLCSLTARVRRLVDDVHDGNLLEASVHAGVPYATLREIHAGRTRSPGIQTLERLARAYGLPLDWFVGGAATDDGTVPLAGWVGFLPADPESGAEWQFARRVTIPYAAWPLIRVLEQLEQRLRDLPPSPSRPILGGATDPRECRRRLTAFILQPLLAARSLGANDVVKAEPPFPGQYELRGPKREQWIDMLRDLGRFWERALGGLLPDLATGAVSDSPASPA